VQTVREQVWHLENHVFLSVFQVSLNFIQNPQVWGFLVFVCDMILGSVFIKSIWGILCAIHHELAAKV
jgi:hypothetical protein